MKKFIIIILMFLISKNSYYGKINNGSTDNVEGEIPQESLVKENEYNLNEEKEQENVKLPDFFEGNKKEIETKQSTTISENKSNLMINQEKKETEKDVKEIYIENKTFEENHIEENNIVAESKSNEIKNEIKYIRNDEMIEKIKKVIQNNETEDMKTYGYTIVIDSSIKNYTNQFTFTENRVKNNIKYSSGTIRIYAEDYYINKQLVMTECYIL